MAIVHEIFANAFGTHIGKHSERIQYTKGKTILQQAPIMHLKQIIIASRGVSISADIYAFL